MKNNRVSKELSFNIVLYYNLCLILNYVFYIHPTLKF
jgi:hypothetical protein